MDEEKKNLDEITDEVETNEQNAEIDEDAQQYMDERNEEKKQIESYRSICRAIVAILFVIAFIGEMILAMEQPFLGVVLILASVLITVLLEKEIDIVCNLFIDVKAIRIQLWKNSQK